MITVQYRFFCELTPQDFAYLCKLERACPGRNMNQIISLIIAETLRVHREKCGIPDEVEYVDL